MGSEQDATSRILEILRRDEKHSANELLPLIYNELRRLAERQLGALPPGQTLGPTALVHEAYLRIVRDGEGDDLSWDSRGHFYSAAAEAMRHILIDRARAKGRHKRGGGRLRSRFDLALESVVEESTPPDDLLDFDDALSRLAAVDAGAAQLVKLRVFAGLRLDEAARMMGLARRTADREWAFARAWLVHALRQDNPDAG